MRKEVSRTVQDLDTFCCLFLAIHVMCCDQDNVFVMVTPRRVILSVGCNSFFVKWSDSGFFYC